MRLLALCIALVAVAAVAEANFAAAPGFSGRVADCSSCHRPPVEGDDASVEVTGIPQSWDVSTDYAWTVSVAGGPIVIPGGPQAGFEIEVLDGVLAPGPDADGDVRGFHERQATYTEDGVFQTEWSVAWTAPDLAKRPAPVTVWVAAVAANGNHNVQLNTSDLGEHGDSVATAVYVIPPSEQAMQAWRELPLAAPGIVSVTPRGDGYAIDGVMTDDNATTLEVHDGTRWVQRPAGPSWRLILEGQDQARLRASGAERLSPEVFVDLASGEMSTQAPAKATPIGPILLPVLLALLIRRTP